MNQAVIRTMIHMSKTKPGSYFVCKPHSDFMDLYVGKHLIKRINYEWFDFCRMMCDVIDQSETYSIILRPRLACAIRFECYEIVMETPAAMHLMDERLDVALDHNDKYRNTAVIITIKPPVQDKIMHDSYDYPDDSCDDDDHIIKTNIPYFTDSGFDVSNIFSNDTGDYDPPEHIRRKYESEKKEEKAASDKLNDKSADRIKSIMQKTMNAVEASKDVPLEFNHDPYIEPSTPTAAVTPEEQSKQQDKIMEDLAKKLEEATNKATDEPSKPTTEIVNDSWDDEDEDK